MKREKRTHGGVLEGEGILYTYIYIHIIYIYVYIRTHGGVLEGEGIDEEACGLRAHHWVGYLQGAGFACGCWDEKEEGGGIKGGGGEELEGEQGMRVWAYGCMMLGRRGRGACM
jgi:hypothetical protein